MSGKDDGATDAPGSDAERRAARMWLSACVAATAAIALASNGAYHDDDLKHYLFARWSRYDLQYLPYVWGRPGFTLLYALPAQLGWWACRLVSVSGSAIAAWAAFRAAQRIGLRRAAWAIPLLYIQPLFLHLSTTTLTETPAAMYLALATWALLANRPRLSAGVFSLALITRHEAVALLPIWAWAVWRENLPPLTRGGRGGVVRHKSLASLRSSWPALALLFWAPAAYNVGTWLAFGYLPGEVFTQPSGAVHYGQGTPITFVVRFVIMAGPVTATLFVVGCRRLWGARPARPLIVGVAAYIAAQTALYMFQAYATGGYARFLVPLAPWVAIAGLAGANALLETAPGRPRLLWLFAALALWVCAEIELAINPMAAIVPWSWMIRLGAMVFVLGVAWGAIGILRTSEKSRPEAAPTRVWARRVCTLVVALAVLGPVGRAAWPHRLRPREQAIADAVGALRERGLLDRPFYSTSDWSYYFAGRWYPARHPPMYEELGSAPPGSLFVWEGKYAPSPDFDLPLETMRGDRRWREIYVSPPDAAGASFVHVFERLEREAPAVAAAHPREGARLRFAFK